jgi:hypothetical protein
LKQAGLAQVKAPENNVDPNNPQPGNTDANGGLPPRTGTRPRLASSSTSLRRGDSDDAPSGPAKSKYTREIIDAMPEDEFDQKLAVRARIQQAGRFAEVGHSIAIARKSEGQSYETQTASRRYQRGLRFSAIIGASLIWKVAVPSHQAAPRSSVAVRHGANWR